MKLKLCGLRRFIDVEYVNETPPDLVGFVFAPSRRQVTPALAAALRAALLPGIRAVGVFVDQPVQEVANAARIAKLDAVQLHGAEDADYIRALQQRLDLPLLKAVRVRAPQDILDAQRLPVQALLLDAFAPDCMGGSGKTADWSSIRAARPRLPFFLAGGLDVHNLARAIEAVSPYGVDLSSGIETGGVKDANKIRRVVQLIRSLDGLDARAIEKD